MNKGDTTPREGLELLICLAGSFSHAKSTFYTCYIIKDEMNLKGLGKKTHLLKSVFTIFSFNKPDLQETFISPTSPPNYGLSTQKKGLFETNLDVSTTVPDI